jgi:hypothetical protein
LEKKSVSDHCKPDHNRAAIDGSMGSNSATIGAAVSTLISRQVVPDAWVLAIAHTEIPAATFVQSRPPHRVPGDYGCPTGRFRVAPPRRLYDDHKGTTLL